MTALERRDVRLALLLGLLFTVGLTLFTLWKWAHLQYNGLDLAIYTQALDETRQGRFLNLTIHPHSYLGDHLELILVALIPFFVALPSPLTLVFLQTLALASGVFPVMILARYRFPTGSIPLWAAAAYLIHPYILNTATYEFHALAFAVPLLLWTLVAYERRHWKWYALALGASLLVREDIGFAALGLGLLALVDRRSWRWSVLPALIGLGWLIIATKLTGHFNAQGSYKFLSYYAWLGPTFRDMILNALSHPWVVLRHLFAPTRILVIIGLLLPFAYLPLLAPRVLIGLAFLLVQQLLAGIGENALKIHYTAPLMPFLVVAALDGLRAIRHAPAGRVRQFLNREWELTRLALTVILLASAVVIGPWGALAIDLKDRQLASAADRKATWAVLRSLPKPVHGVSSFRLITPLAQSPAIYSSHYVFLGHRQYVKLPYPIGPDVDTAVFDDRDLLTSQMIYPETNEDFRGGNDRIAALLRERNLTLEQQIGHVFVFKQNGATAAAPDLRPAAQRLDQALLLTGRTAVQVSDETIGRESFRVATFSLRFRATKTMAVNRQLRVTLRDDRGTLQREFFALNPLHSTSTWQENEEVSWTYRPVLSRPMQGRLIASIEVVEVKGEGLLNGFRGIEPRYTMVRTIGHSIELSSEM